jgi:hypothetical protein
MIKNVIYDIYTVHGKLIGKIHMLPASQEIVQVRTQAVGKVM